MEIAATDQVVAGAYIASSDVPVLLAGLIVAGFTSAGAFAHPSGLTEDHFKQLTSKSLFLRDIHEKISDPLLIQSQCFCPAQRQTVLSLPHRSIARLIS